jgi:hypothetical protein
MACRQLAAEAKKLPVGQHDVLTHNTSIFNGNTLRKPILPLLLFFCLKGKNSKMGKTWVCPTVCGGKKVDSKANHLKFFQSQLFQKKLLQNFLRFQEN